MSTAQALLQKNWTARLFFIAAAFNGLDSELSNEVLQKIDCLFAKPDSTSILPGIYLLDFVG